MAATEEKGIDRTYSLSPDVAQRIKSLADEHQLHHSSLVNFLLRHALDDVAAGKVKIRRRPVAYAIDTSAT